MLILRERNSFFRDDHVDRRAVQRNRRAGADGQCFAIVVMQLTGRFNRAFQMHLRRQFIQIRAQLDADMGTRLFVFQGQRGFCVRDAGEYNSLAMQIFRSQALL